MSFIRTAWVALIASALMVCSAQAADEPRELNWEDLRPQIDMKEVKPLDLDGDGVVTDQELSNAPESNSVADAAVPELNGKRIKIPAFIVPLDGNSEKLTELLLVPYFGACIHVPPPPPNQIIHVKPEGEGVEIGELDLYEPVYAIGVLKTQSIDHDIAQIGYKMTVEKLEPYTDN